MGEHKYNPTAQKAKEGLLPPKPKGLSKRERERNMKLFIENYIERETGMSSALFDKPYSGS